MLNKKEQIYKKRHIVFYLLVVCFMFLFGCGTNQEPYDYEFVNKSWTRNAENDTEYISFSEDGFFSYYCACGNPVNDSDLCEGYTYNPNTKIIKLSYLEKTEETILEIKLIECKTDTLTLDFNGDIRTFTLETEEEDTTPETMDYQGNTYHYLEYKQDIFYYDMNSNTYLEEDIIHAIPNEKWDIIYYNGDLFVLGSMVEEAKEYYSNDANYTWSIEIDSADMEDVDTYPLSINEEDLRYIYSFEDIERETTLSFDDIERFATLKKTSKDGLICGTTSLAFYDGLWYWRSEIIDESQEGWPEYVFKLPKELNEQISSLEHKK